MPDVALTRRLCVRLAALSMALDADREAVADLRDELARIAATTDGPTEMTRAAASDTRNLVVLTGATGSTAPAAERWLVTLLRDCEAL